MTTEFIDVELGLGFGLDDSDWGLFIILDEEEKKQTRMKYILQIETIEEEGTGEYETEETYGNKIEYYKSDLRIEREQEDYKEKDKEKDKDYKEKDKDYKEKDKDYTDDEDKDDEDTIKFKIKFAITYVLTTSFSIALIILTFIV
jgi:hypothetical protein